MTKPKTSSGVITSPILSTVGPQKGLAPQKRSKDQRKPAWTCDLPSGPLSTRHSLLRATGNGFKKPNVCCRFFTAGPGEALSSTAVELEDRFASISV
jgi:hypothetical protein